MRYRTPVFRLRDREYLCESQIPGLITLPDFRNEDGTTRIRYLWDQSLKAVEGEHVPKEYGMGVEYTKEEIDAAFPDFYHVITPKNIVTQGAITIRTRDIFGHGTAGSRHCGWKWKRKRRCLCRSYLKKNSL